MYKLAVIVGSLRRESTNLKLAKALCETGKDLFDSKILPIGDLPLFNEDLENAVPASVEALRNGIKEADAVLFVTPEYNRSLPPAMKNAVDWASRPAGKGCLGGKAAATAGTSPGAVGTALAQTHLRTILLMQGMYVLGSPEMFIGARPDMFAADGSVASPDTVKYLRRYLETFNAWIKQSCGK